MICLIALPLLVRAKGSEEPLPPVAEIPGLTVEDRFPRGCVDCHINLPELGQDERLSSIMAHWVEQVPPELLEKAANVADSGASLKGRHPLPTGMFRSVPETCLDCHEKGPGAVVPLVPLIHRIHLSDREENHFMTIFQGHCTHCHKFDPGTGVVSVPSAPEN